MPEDSLRPEVPAQTLVRSIADNVLEVLDDPKRKGAAILRHQHDVADAGADLLYGLAERPGTR